MATVADELDLIQKYLRDRDGVIWSRSELLRHLNDGYRRLLAESEGVRVLTILPVPPRYAFAGCYSWEARYAQGGTFRHWTYSGPGGTYQSTTLWEIEQNAGIDAPTSGHTCTTSLWELAYVDGEVDTDYRFALPKNHQRIKALWYDHRPITPMSSRELDHLESAWNRAQGEPWVWLPGYGESRSFEVYHIRTPYSDDYGYLSDAFYGIPRMLSGARDYEASGVPLVNGYAYTTQADAVHWAVDTSPALPGFGIRITQDPTPNPGAQYQGTQVWERERHEGATSFTTGETIGTAAFEAHYSAANMGDYPTGLLREVSSPDRQYLPVAEWDTPYGTIRSWASSEGNLLVHEVVIPDVPALTEADTPTMMPAQLCKYIRCWVLYCAFARMGEGFRPDLAAHWKVRWERGPALLRKLGDITYADVQYQRQAGRPDRTGRLSRTAPLPPEYGNVRV